LGQKLIVSPCNKYTKLYLHIAVLGVVQREVAAAVVPLVAIEESHRLALKFTCRRISERRNVNQKVLETNHVISRTLDSDLDLCAVHLPLTSSTPSPSRLYKSQEPQKKKVSYITLLLSYANHTYFILIVTAGTRRR